MTDNIVQIRDYGVYSFSLPAPALIPIPAIAKAFTKLIEADDRFKRTQKERDLAERRLLDAQSEDAIRMTELYDQGKGEDADPQESTAVAEAELKKAKARVDPARNAAAIAARELREAIAGNRKEWQKAARARAEGARDKLALALKSVEVQRAELNASVGVLELLHGEVLRDVVHAQWSFGAPETDIAIEALAEAVGVVSMRVRIL